MHAERATGSGATIVRLDVIGTVVFAVMSGLAAGLFTDGIKAAAVVIDLLLFAIGVFTFLWSYWTAVQRSRTDNIAVAQLYFLASGSAPKGVQRRMNALLLAQVAIGLGTAIARSSTDGKAGSTLAFGILVPMFGLGLNGLWCARHGSFSARGPAANATGTDDSAANATADGTADSAASRRVPADGAALGDPTVPTSDDEMEQNSHHG